MDPQNVAIMRALMGHQTPQQDTEQALANQNAFAQMQGLQGGGQTGQMLGSAMTDPNLMAGSLGNMPMTQTPQMPPAMNPMLTNAPPQY